MYNNAGMFSVYTFMLNAVYQIIHRYVCSQGTRPLYKASPACKTDKRMLELASVGLYGHDGEWRATISKFVSTAPVILRNSAVFVFSLCKPR